jgi:hypothetical protein
MTSQNHIPNLEPTTPILQSYCDEYSFRYNRRNEGQPMFTSL